MEESKTRVASKVVVGDYVSLRGAPKTRSGRKLPPVGRVVRIKRAIDCRSGIMVEVKTGWFSYIWLDSSLLSVI